MSEKNIDPRHRKDNIYIDSTDIENVDVGAIGINLSNNLEKPSRRMQKVADFVTKAVLADPEPIVFKDKDGSEITIENRGGIWRL